MPRKHPPREYYTEEDEVHYDVEPDRRRPRRRSKRDRVVEEEPVEDYYRRRPPEPPVEDLERMRIRGRPSLKESHSKAPPPGLKFRRGHGEVKDIPPPPPSPPSERERDEYQPPPRSKKAPPPPRGKKNKKIESDEYVYKEDHHGGRRGKGKQIAEVLSDSDVDDMSVRRSSRAAARPPPPPPPVAALPPDDYDSEEEYARRERRRRKGKIPVEPQYVREEVVAAPPRYPHKPNVGRHRGKEQADARRAASRPRVRSWSSRRNASESEESESSSTTTTESDTEDSDEDDDDEEDDEIVVLKKEWGRGHRRDSSRAPAAIKGRKSDSSPGSPSLREASPDLAPRHHRRPKYIEQEYEVVQPPPPPPALEPPPPPKGNYELEVRHRGRKGRSQDDSVLAPRHGRGDPYMDQPPPPRESSRRRRKVEGTQIAPLKPQAIDYGNYGKDLAIRERSHRTKDSRDVRDDMELDLYSKRRPELAPYPRPPSGPAAEELPFMGAPPPVPGAFPAPHPQPMMPMARGPHPNEMGWPQPRGVPPQQYYPQPEEFSDGEEIDDGHVGPGRRYIGMKDRRDRLWTEITKDLVVRDAVEKLGYEYEETDYFFYIFSYLHYEDVAALVELSDEIRHSRRRRIHEINRGRGSYPHPPAHPQVPPMQPVAAAPAPAPAPMPVTSGPMGPMGPMAPVAPVPPPGYEKYAAAAAAAAAAANAAPAPAPPPMMNHPQPWSWDGGRGREREMAYEDSRWQTPGAWPRW